MTGFSKTFKDGIIIKTLVFRDKEFKVTMGKWKNGCRTSDCKGFYYQLKEELKGECCEEEIEEIAYGLDFGDEGEIEESLEMLNDVK